MSGGGLAADSFGNLYFNTGNGTIDANSLVAPNDDYGDTVVKLALGANVDDWFTPFNQDALNTGGRGPGIQAESYCCRIALPPRSICWAPAASREFSIC
jgi:hypothetical protein